MNHLAVSGLFNPLLLSTILINLLIFSAQFIHHGKVNAMINLKKISILSAMFFAASLFGVIKFLPNQQLPHESEQLGKSGAMQALEEWSRARAYPFNDIPPDGYMKAYQSSKTSMKNLPRSPLVSSTWEPIGPLDTDSRGRTISVAINPMNVNTIYCGAASGGLWRSRQASTGGDWVRLNLGFPALGIAAIVIDPADTNTMYLGTGEVYRYGVAVGGLIVRTTRGSYGVGILKSTDGGTTWTKSLDWTYNQQRGVQQIKINPLNRNTVVAATTEGVYRSFDGGNNWSLVLPVVMATDIVYNRKDTTQLLAACGNFKSTGYGIYRSTDGGTNWSITSGGQSNYSGKTHLDAYYANSSTVYASVADSTTGVGSLWRSVDFGGTWTQINTDAIFGVQGWYSHFVAVKPTDSSRIVHAGLSAYKSINGGISFVGSGGGYSDNHNYAYEPGHPDILYVVNDNGIYRSTNFGDSFSNIGNGMQTLQFYNGFSNSSTDSLLAMGQVQDHIPGYIYRGSTVWQRSAYDECGWTGIDPTNDFVMYAAGRGDVSGTNIVKSTDRGNSFFGAGGFSGPAAWNSPFVIAPSSTNILYFGSAYVYRSANAAGSWAVTNGGAALDGNPALSMAISSTNPDTVIVGMAPYVARSHIFLTTNGGTSWSNITGILPDRYPMDLAINPKNTKTMFATFGGFGTGHVFKSTNLGTTWTDISGTLPDAPTPAILVDPIDTSVVFVGNDIGVYISTNSGASWSGYSEGLPEAVISADLSMNLSAHKLRIATHGNGVYERSVLIGQAPVNFDYKAFGFIAPLNGSEALLGSPISPIKASFRNNGALAQTDSFDVRYRIRLGVTDVYSHTIRIAGLGLAEIRQITFAGSYIPSDSGTYTIQAITLASDQDPTNDTLNGSFHVIVPPSITTMSVTKSSCTYTPITGGSAGPVGDDVQAIAALPFPFVYDGYSYDSVQISTNGWLEFGTGTQGSLFGISTSGQVGGFFNPVLATTARPTKVLGLWWSDLGTGSIGAITYRTLGIAPNRIFIVQWKDVLANFNESVSTMKINFQVYLFEGTNAIEYHYGPVIAGTFSGVGASIGMKDYLGGDYHYYDIAAMKTGLASELTSDRNPVTSWPGPDSCYHIQGAGNALYVNYTTNWNMVSVPLLQSNYSVTALFPSTLNGRAFEYSGGAYHMKDSLLPGTGYWIKLPGPVLKSFTGSSLSSVTQNLEKGWNMIGSVDHDVPAPSGGIVSSLMYGYSGGYSITSTVKPGKAYWVKTSAPGSITLGPTALPKSTPEDFSSYNSITFKDNLGREQVVYIAEGSRQTIHPELYEMPPPSPEGFDIRFVSQRILELVDDNRRHEFVLSISAAEFPITVSWKISSPKSSVHLQTGSFEQTLAGTGSTLMKKPEPSVRVTYENGAPLPKEFSLSQNYPNPFNPKTRIDYALPVSGRVSIRIFNVLGEEIATLFDDVAEAGFHSIDWDAASTSGGMPSGMYLCRINAGTFSSAKKMLLIR